MINIQIAVKELLLYNLTDEQIIVKLQSDKCTKEEIIENIIEVKQIIAEEKLERKKRRCKQYYINNKKEIKNKQKEYNLNNTEPAKRRSRKHTVKKYGLTLEQYNEILNKQHGKCAICGKHHTELKQSLCIDHNHETCNVRGLLCVKCNRAIGMLGDNVQLLAIAIDYLNNTEVLVS